MQLAVRTLIHGAHACRGVTRPEGDEHPHQLAFRVASQLEHEGERPLGRRRVGIPLQA